MTTTEENPWLVASAALGIMGTLGGLFTALLGFQHQTEFNDQAWVIFAGFATATAGVAMSAGWLVAAAICWQVKHR